ncbi:diacylglycerol/lipid kinase family protein [Puia sp.]|uniref:diacylglycerol/lipid kinase family protein n=1 Tax=Puia sp. TaxID=2045100 RepID=UPI002F3FD857
MARNIIYLINPISGTRGKQSLQETIRQKTQEKGIAYSILPTNPEGDYAFLIPFIQKAAVTDIVVCGGDGTVSAVAAALSGEDVRVGIIPMGSGNGLAFAAGIPKDVEKALEIVFAAKSAPIDGFLINGQFSCMLCGIGFDAKVAEEFAEQPRRGLQTYIRVTLRNFFGARHYPFTLHIPGSNGTETTLREEAFFISIANGNQFGNNFTIAPKASLHDGLLDIVIAKRTNRLRFLLSVIRQVLGGYPVQSQPEKAGRGRMIYFQTASLVIENPGEAPLHIDGDPKPSASEFHIGIVPNAIRLILP